MGQMGRHKLMRHIHDHLVFLRPALIISGNPPFLKSHVLYHICSETQSSPERAVQLSFCLWLVFSPKSNTIERAVNTRLTDDLSRNNLHNANHAYCKKNSPLKLLSSTFMTTSTSSMLLVLSRSLVYVFLIFLLPLTLLTTTFFSLVYLLGSVSMVLLSAGFVTVFRLQCEPKKSHQDFLSCLPQNPVDSDKIRYTLSWINLRYSNLNVFQLIWTL